MSDLLFEADMTDMKKLLEECENMVITDNYVVDEYTKERDRELELAKESGVDLEPYLNEEYTGFQLHEIRLGLEEGLDVKLYDNTEFSWEQMRQIRKGLEADIDVSEYADPLYSDMQMREIRLGIEEGVDIYCYAKLLYSTTDMRRIRSELFSEKYYSNPVGFGKIVTDHETGITIRFSDDLMKAFITVPGKDVISEGDLYTLLEDYDITYGYIPENIKKAAQEGSGREILAAQGDCLQKGCDGSYDMLWQKSDNNQPHIRKDGTMDFASVDFVDMVQTGQPIAVYTPAVKGKDGRTVNDMVIEERSGKDLPPLKGINIMLRADKVTYVAKKDGYIIYDEKRHIIEIQDVLVIKGNVNRLYGNVFYDGSLRIKGNVEDGAVISAKGDVIIEGYVQSAYISAGNNVVVIGGVNANDSGYIAAQGGVYAEYLENSVIYTGQDVKANYILNSRIEAGTEVTVKGGKGVICGGVLSAGNAVTAQSLGNKSFIKTVIIVGKNSIITEHLVSAKTFKAEIERDLNTLKKGADHLRHTVPPDQIDKNDMYIKLRFAIRMKEQSLTQVNKDISNIEAFISNTEHASVNVPGTAYPNTELHINEVTKLLNDESFHVTFVQTGDSITKKRF